jgi:Tfp pilus assembly pilus retraction ATPase PilT
MTGGAAGMITMDKSLLNLYQDRLISHDDLFMYCVDSSYINQNMIL